MIHASILTNRTRESRPSSHLHHTPHTHPLAGGPDGVRESGRHACAAALGVLRCMQHGSSAASRIASPSPRWSVRVYPYQEALIKLQDTQPYISATLLYNRSIKYS